MIFHIGKNQNSKVESVVATFPVVDGFTVDLEEELNGIDGEINEVEDGEEGHGEGRRRRTGLRRDGRRIESDNEHDQVVETRGLWEQVRL